MSGATLGPVAVEQIRQLIRESYFHAGLVLPSGENIGRANVRFLGRAASYIARGSTGDITLYHGTPGSETTLSRTVSAYARYGSIAPGYDCEVYILDGTWTAHQPDHRWFAQTDTAHNKGASGTVSIYSGSTAGSETDTTNNLSSVWNYFGNVATGKKVHVRIVESGPGIIAAEC